MNIDYEKLLTTDSEGKVSINEAELKKVLQTEGDRRATEASNTTKAKLESDLKESITKQVKADLEADAKLNAEEKFQKEMDKEREKFRNERLEFNKKQVVAMFEGKKIEKADYEPFLSFVTDDTEKSLELATNHISSIEKIAEKQVQEKLKENMGANSDAPAGGEGNKQAPKPLVTAF